ncbi:MAG: alpha/beta fold hydrolase [Pseudomonadota bacterium]
MLANIQRFITLTLVAVAVGWLLYWRNSAPLLALAGFMFVALGYTAFLALEFVLLRFINQSDPAPQPTIAELLRAWVGEVLVAPQVFCWRQPFRSRAVPDRLLPGDAAKRRPGVVFVHGFFCNRGLWTPWLKRLEESGHAFIAVNLEPVFGSIDDYAPQIETAVNRMIEATGVPPLLVCHSMGGLAVRAWLRINAGEARVHHVVTIGTPHRGTWLARFGHGHNGLQMRLASSWQAQLDLGMPADRHSLFTCWYSNTDNIVFPASTATLPNADNRLLRGVAHVQMAFTPEVMNASLALLGKPRLQAAATQVV